MGIYTFNNNNKNKRDILWEQLMTITLINNISHA